MHFKFNNELIRYTGRWGFGENSAVETAAGSYFEFKFEGDMALLKFDISFSDDPRPHLYICVDNGAFIESELEPFIRIKTQTYGEHTVMVLHKSSLEMQHRWFQPLIGKVEFLDIETEKLLPLPEDTRKIIEFVGDSITEGVLIDEEKKYYQNEWENRVFQDDVTATYAYLTAQNLNLRAIFMGYGAVGTTKMGCGSVPRAAVAYPYCYNNMPITHKSADYILINHGANDQSSGVENYLKGYKELLDIIIQHNKKSKIIVLSPFCGAFHIKLNDFVLEYNKMNNCDILFIDSSDWIPREPLHPLRDGHKIISEHLTEILKQNLK